jgi:hypothetical protein
MKVMAHWKKLLHAWYSNGELKSQEKNELKEIQEKLKTLKKYISLFGNGY